MPSLYFNCYLISYMRIHIVGTPRNPSTPIIAVDPFARVSYYLTTMLHRNNVEVYYYGYETSTVECTKKYSIVDDNFHSKYFTKEFENSQWNYSTEGENIFVSKAIESIKSNLHPEDLIVSTWGSQIPKLQTLENNGVKVIDGHVGYLYDSGAKYKVFTSRANQHYIYGTTNSQGGFWNDIVIPPPANSITEFEFNPNKQGYFLYIARLIEQKGIFIFLDLARSFPEKSFILAGQGDISLLHCEIPPNVEYVGYADLNKRKTLLANASAVISPTHYVEPFGLTSVEAALSGTPIITTSWGGYIDNVVEGVTGFKCSSFKEFKEAINKVHQLDALECRKFGERFTAEYLIHDYIKYFKTIIKNNWYEN